MNQMKPVITRQGTCENPRHEAIHEEVRTLLQGNGPETYIFLELLKRITQLIIEVSDGLTPEEAVRLMERTRERPLDSNASSFSTHILNTLINEYIQEMENNEAEPEPQACDSCKDFDDFTQAGSEVANYVLEQLLQKVTQIIIYIGRQKSASEGEAIMEGAARVPLDTTAKELSTFILNDLIHDYEEQKKEKKNGV